jgi:hypothetical protein
LVLGLLAGSEATAGTGTPQQIRCLSLTCRSSAAQALYAPVFAGPSRPVNLARFNFLSPQSRTFSGTWERVADDTVAMLRTEAGRDPYDKDLTDLVGVLSTPSEEFRIRWSAHDVQLLHPYFQQPEVQAFNAEHGIVTQAWSPIGGITFYREGEHTSTLEDPAIVKIAESRSKSPAQVMLRWHMQEGRPVIPKSTKPHRIAENFDVSDFELTTDEVAAIDGLDTGKRGGPEPDAITLDSFGREIPEA